MDLAVKLLMACGKPMAIKGSRGNVTSLALRNKCFKLFAWMVSEKKMAMT
jgi:hypothetical protein